MPLTHATEPDSANLRQIADLANAFIDVALRLNVPHQLALQALATAYLAVAKQHTCCLPLAASNAHTLAARLDLAAADLPTAIH